MDFLQKRFQQADVLRAVPRLGANRLQMYVHRENMPGKEQAPGSGRRRSWSLLDIIIIAVTFELTRMGVEARYAAKLAQMVTDYVLDVKSGKRPADAGNMYLIIVPDREGDDKFHATLISQVMINEKDGNPFQALGMGRQPLALLLSIDDTVDGVMEALGL